MDLLAIIRELRVELDRIDAAIQSLERLDGLQSKRKGRLLQMPDSGAPSKFRPRKTAL